MTIWREFVQSQRQQTSSFNDDLETARSLQPLLFNVLLCNRFRIFLITGKVNKAFLQIRVQECNCDAQQMLWCKNLRDRQVTDYRSIHMHVSYLEQLQPINHRCDTGKAFGNIRSSNNPNAAVQMLKEICQRYPWWK